MYDRTARHIPFKCLFFPILLIFSVGVRSQSVADSVALAGFTLEDSLADKLADYALAHNPGLVQANKAAEGSLYEWKKSKASLLNNFSASFNLNEANLMPPEKMPNLFYPRYNIGLMLPLGTFFTKPKDTKKAKTQYEGLKAATESTVLQLRQAVQTACQTLNATKYLLALQASVVQDEEVLFEQVQGKFQKNQASLEQFTNASKRYNAELVRKVSLMRDYNLSKIELEALLGTTLEDALQKIQNLQVKKPSLSNSRR